MRRLRDFQIVRVTAGVRQVDAHVLAVTQGRATLEPRMGQARRATGLNGPATLHFQHEGHPVAIAGQAIGMADGILYFAADDHVAQPEPRHHPRLPIDLEAELQAEAGGDVVRTTTRDISEGGMRVRATGLAGAYRIELRIPGSQVPLLLTGTVRREDADGAAIAFDVPSRQVAGRLRDIVMTVRRGVVRAR